MTLREVIAWADRMKPDNRFTNDEKTTWINELEGMVQREALLEAAEVEYEYSTDADTELIVSHPYDKLYRHYLLSQISYANEEYDRYNNELEMFNSCWRDFLLWVCSSVRPAYKKQDWLPAVWHIVRGETPVIEFFALPLAAEEITAAGIFVQQGGETVLEFDSQRIILENCSASVQLTQEESLTLKAGTALITIVIANGAGERYEQYPPNRLIIAETQIGSVIG